MHRHKCQSDRFELKYLIEEDRARVIRDHVSSYLELDTHARQGPGASYPVFSLYLDSPSLTVYQQTIQGKEDRFKLRIRCYDDLPTTPAYLEIKQRFANGLHRQRAAVRREGMQRLLDGSWPDKSQLVFPGNDSSDWAAVQQFCELRDKVGAIGSAFVRYDREAYVSEQSNQLRVTFDHDVRGGLIDRVVTLPSAECGVPIGIPSVVFEIKFTDQLPPWLQDTVWAFDLEECAVGKYVHCIDALRHPPHIGSARDSAARAPRFP